MTTNVILYKLLEILLTTKCLKVTYLKVMLNLLGVNKLIAGMYLLCLLFASWKIWHSYYIETPKLWHVFPAANEHPIQL